MCFALICWSTYETSSAEDCPPFSKRGLIITHPRVVELPLLFARAKLKSLMYDCQFFLVQAFNRTGINCQCSTEEEIQFEIWDSRIFGAHHDLFDLSSGDWMVSDCQKSEWSKNKTELQHHSWELQIQAKYFNFSYESAKNNSILNRKTSCIYALSSFC